MLRWRIRTLFIAVGVVGLLLGGAAEWRRRVAADRLNAIRGAQFFRLFLFHRAKEQNYEFTDRWEISDTPGFYEKIDAFYKIRYGHHKRLRLKYEAAMERPWLPVAPDPPEPSF